MTRRGGRGRGRGAIHDPRVASPPCVATDALPARSRAPPRSQNGIGGGQRGERAASAEARGVQGQPWRDLGHGDRYDIGGRPCSSAASGGFVLRGRARLHASARKRACPRCPRVGSCRQGRANRTGAGPHPAGGCAMQRRKSVVSVSYPRSLHARLGGRSQEQRCRLYSNIDRRNMHGRSTVSMRRLSAATKCGPVAASSCALDRLANGWWTTREGKSTPNRGSQRNGGSQECGPRQPDSWCAPCAIEQHPNAMQLVPNAPRQHVSAWFCYPSSLLRASVRDRRHARRLVWSKLLRPLGLLALVYMLCATSVHPPSRRDGGATLCTACVSVQLASESV